MNLLAPFGFYGWGNIGDESTLQGFARLISRHNNGMRVWVASRNPSHTAKVEPSFKYYKAVGRDLRRKWAGYRATAAVVAGGTPIMDVFGNWPLGEIAPLVVAASDQHKPFAFVGCGTETLHREESRRIVRDVVSPRVRHWTVRSERDKDRLTDYGVPTERVTIAADLAWTLEPVTKGFGQEYLARLGLNPDNRYVGVNLTSERFVLAQEPGLFSKVATFLDRIIEKDDLRVLFLANEIREDDTFDTAASRRVLASMKYPDRALMVPNRYWSPQEMMSLIACCELTVGMRYHFCLFSALQGVPFIALKRSDKVEDLCWDLGWSYGLPLTDLHAAALVTMYADLEQARPSCLAALQNRVHRMRDRAFQNRIALEYLGND
ncbi:MAG: polysaccharide pyruvyl transferase family protein [Vitreimonas sp.]